MWPQMCCLGYNFIALCTLFYVANLHSFPIVSKRIFSLILYHAEKRELLAWSILLVHLISSCHIICFSSPSEVARNFHIVSYVHIKLIGRK